MAGPNFGKMSLYASEGGRKYLNSTECRRFIRALDAAPAPTRLFCILLFWSGSRISEALALTADSFDLDDGIVMIETLKRRRRGVIRHVPLPNSVLHELDRAFRLRGRQRAKHLANERLWLWSRATAWRRVKQIMSTAGITGPAAMPKGLRHAFGVAAFRASVPPHLVQRWLGHASLETTTIYGDVVGKEEQEFAARIWRDRQSSISGTQRRPNGPPVV